MNKQIMTQLCQYSPPCIFQYTIVTLIATNYLLLVKIIDINDNTPVFSQTSYAVTLSGISHIGKTILKVTAIDLDDASNGKIFYDLEESAESNL